VPAGSPLAAPMMALVALPGALQRRRQGAAAAAAADEAAAAGEDGDSAAADAADDAAARYRGAATSCDAKRAQDALFARTVECPVKCVQGVLYARVSCAVYNVLEDYARLAAAGLEVAAAAEAEAEAEAAGAPG